MREREEGRDGEREVVRRREGVSKRGREEGCEEKGGGK